MYQINYYLIKEDFTFISFLDVLYLFIAPLRGNENSKLVSSKKEYARFQHYLLKCSAESYVIARRRPV